VVAEPAALKVRMRQMRRACGTVRAGRPNEVKRPVAAGVTAAEEPRYARADVGVARRNGNSSYPRSCRHLPPTPHHVAVEEATAREAGEVAVF